MGPLLQGLSTIDDLLKVLPDGFLAGYGEAVGRT